MTGQVREKTNSIVAIGRFNPLIFQPEWLRANGVIGKGAAEQLAAGIEVIHPEITNLNIDSLRISIDQARFSATTLEDPSVRVFDFCVSCFSLLPHTPISAVGINLQTKFRLSSDEEWNSFGDKIAPKEAWDTLFGATTGKDRTGGLRTMTMERNKRPDRHLGYIRTTVEAVPGEHPDTMIMVNDHYQLGTDRLVTAADVVDLLEEQWETSLERSTKITDALMGAIGGK